MPALIGVEAGLGIYNFGHTFANGQGASIRVMPISFNAKYYIELSKMFRLYPYVGFQNRIVSAASSQTNAFLADLRGVRVMAGGGTNIVMSENMDARFEVGIDGYLFGVVAKF